MSIPLWSDEFDGVALDQTKWVYWNPGKRRHAMNVPEAVTLRDGFLTIATYTESGKHFTGMISTRDKYEAQYGYYEARIQWADAPGQWSAFWSQTPTIGKPIDDVAAAGMEIDFVEHRAVDHEGKPLAAKANFTLHCTDTGRITKAKATRRQTSAWTKVSTSMASSGPSWPTAFSSTESCSGK